MLAFSTCWNSANHNDGEDIIDEILELGFTNIELSHGISISKYPGLKRAFKQGKFNCCGVHNYFPAPIEILIDAPDVFEFSSSRSYHRTKAMRLAKKSLENAAEFDAKYLILHMGSTPMKYKKWTRRLTQMAKNQMSNCQSYEKLVQKFIKKRSKYSKKFFARSLEALNILADLAQEMGVKLAIEGRSRYEDIPNEEEMRELLKYFKDNPWIGYWHDFGHAQLKHNLNLLDHSDWLHEMREFLFGSHLHDVVYPAQDHLPPFMGELNFSTLLRQVDPKKPLVWEINNSHNKSHIRSSLKQWNHQFPEFSHH